MKVIHVCGGVPAEIGTVKLDTPRQRWKAEHQLARIRQRLEESRGTTMNLHWLGWFGAWQDLHDQICPNTEGTYDCGH